MTYRVTVRRGPKVEHSKHDSLDDALTVVEADARTAPRRGSVEFLSRRYEPGDVVAVRIEPQPGESALAALRRSLHE